MHGIDTKITEGKSADGAAPAWAQKFQMPGEIKIGERYRKDFGSVDGKLSEPPA